MVFSAIRMSVSNFNTLVKIALVFELVAPPGQSEAWRPSQELFGATGSSILLPGFSAEDFKNVQYVNWAFSGTPILDYYNVTQIPTFTNLYKNRCSFFSSNGSLLLKNVTSDDRGLYKVKINLNESRSNVIKLNVIEPLSKPSIFSNSNYVDTTIELICQVSAGKASSILWWKGDAVITNGQHYQLAQSNSTVTISKAIKSDCGNYTCKMENFVSKNQTSYLLAIYGLPPLHHCIVGLSITALISAAAVIIGIIILCLHQDSQTISLKFQNNMLLFLQIAAMVSVAILLAAFVCWIKAEGISGVTGFMLVLLCVLLIITILSACSMKVCDVKWLNKIVKSRPCRVTLDTVTPLDGIIVTCASSILIAEIIKQADIRRYLNSTEGGHSAHRDRASDNVRGEIKETSPHSATCRLHHIVTDFFPKCLRSQS
ncbi:uncharacterized protein [Heterodontus francisci]|uniref:uncharacterized protein isoform X2 n=1 Tax=Heterodontus francisci TaxID=7792 RepID=UPI00355C19E7